MKTFELNPQKRIPLLKLQTHHSEPERVLPVGATQTHPRNQSTGQENASIYFIGTATTVLEWSGIRILTDPNFLHAGDHVHLGPGVTAERLTNPAVDIDKLPPLDCILLSHYHEDHFDRLVEDSLDRQFPIISTPHAKKHLSSKPEPFQAVHDLDFFESMLLPIAPPPPPGSQQQNRKAVVRVTGMPGKHVPPGPLNVANEILGAVPPTNGWLLELGYIDDAPAADVQVGYRIYISGDTLLVDELKEIPKRLNDEKIDLMLVHLGGTTIPSRKLPLLMVTMDAKQGLQLMRLMDPDVTIPIHYDDYDLFMSPLEHFKKTVTEAGLDDRVVYLDRGDMYKFEVRDS